MPIEITYTLESIKEVAEKIFEQGKPHTVWAFDAPMGAGKTTLINLLCKHIFLIKDTTSSPTFSIINEYESPIYGKVAHMDWYRLKDEEDAILAGVEDALDHSAYSLVEWPEKAVGLLPEDTFFVRIEVLDEHHRKIRC